MVLGWRDAHNHRVQASTIAMESSGRFRQLLAQMAHIAGICVFVLKALDVQRYAKAISALGKTDLLGAGAMRYLKAWQLGEPIAERL